MNARSVRRAMWLAGTVVAVLLAPEALLVGAGSQAPTPAAGTPAVARFPGSDWERIEKPESIGYSSARLEAVRAWVRSLDTTSMIVVVGGRVVLAYGDQAHLSYLASVRKSVLAMLYGRYVENGTIKPTTTLKDLEFTDVGGLMPRELEATVEDLITARSGVYHPASNAGDDTASAPPRGSQRRGAYFLYNNWDFNAAGGAFEKLTGRDIYDALETDIAQPTGMQDFRRSAQPRSGDAKVSQFLAYHMYLSVRDMARIGLLMQREGNWAGRQVVPRNWVRRIASLVTPLNEMNPPRHRALGSGERWGYGCLWWVWDAPNSPGPFEGAYTGMGAGGQYITVLPALDMVVAHKTDTGQASPHGPSGRNRSVSSPEYHATLKMLIAARCPGGKCG